MSGPVDRWRVHLATVLVACLLAGGFVAFLLGRAGAFDGAMSRYELSVVVPTAVSLAKKGDVRIAGLKVGEVQEVQRRGNTAIVKLALERKYAPVRQDARVQIRLRTLVGENYVELYPGDAQAKAIPDGGMLPMQQALSQVDIDTILATLDPASRARARGMLQNLGRGVQARGDKLNDLVGASSDAITEAEPVAATLARERRHVAGVVDNLGEVMGAIGQRGDDVRTLVGRGVSTARALASRDEQLEATFRALPGALSQVRSTTRTLQAVSRTATPVLRNATAAASDAKPAVEDLAPAADTGRRVIAELGRASGPVRQALVSLRRASPAAVAALPRLNDLLHQTNPALQYVSKYSKEAGAFFASFRSATDYYDATGNALRSHSIVAPFGAAVFDDETYAVVKDLFNSGLLSSIRKVGNNPYPAPGGAGALQEWHGDFPQLTPEPTR